MKIIDLVSPLFERARPAIAGVGKSAGAAESLRQGDFLRAKVLELLADGRVRLDINGTPLTAKSLVSLTPGNELWLEVSRGGTMPLLTVAGKENAMQELVKALLAGGLGQAGMRGQALTPSHVSASVPQESMPSSVGGAPGRGSFLAELFSAVQEESSSPETIRILASLLSIRRTPVLHALEILAGRVRDKGREQSEGGISEKMVRLLEVHQEVNSQPLRESDRNLYLFPCFFSGEESWGEWMLDLHQEGAPPGEEHYRITFFLDMSRLGPLSIHVSLSGKRIIGQFYLQDAETCSHLQASLPELRHLLERQGYFPVSLSSQVETRHVISRLKDELERTGASNRFSLVDLSV